jgi:hypothetical protein
MFVFTSKAKILAISLTVIGSVMLVIGFNSPSSSSHDILDSHHEEGSHSEVTHHEEGSHSEVTHHEEGSHSEVTHHEEGSHSEVTHHEEGSHSGGIMKRVLILG